MQQTKLHIVSFDIPYPAEYGGAIDVFYKIKALSEAGVEIYLHCFEYGRAHAKELEQLCKKVWYYPRHIGARGISLSMPYIVYSRRSEALLKNLILVDAPILFEGVHSTYYLSHPELKSRFKIVRAHNIEHQYYQELYKRETQSFKRFYYKTEAALLRRYETKLNDSNAFVPLSMADGDYFETLYSNAAHKFIGPFHPYQEVMSETGKGDYCLYHGNLSHPENKEAALFLLNEVFNKTKLPVIIAGRNPSKELADACSNIAHCKLVANPTNTEMEQLITDAHIHVLPTFQPTGMKLKLLYALFNGRHVIANDDMLAGTGLERICSIANTANQFSEAINTLFELPFTEADIQNRNNVVGEHYNNQKNVRQLLKLLP